DTADKNHSGHRPQKKYWHHNLLSLGTASITPDAATCSGIRNRQIPLNRPSNQSDASTGIRLYLPRVDAEAFAKLRRPSSMRLTTSSPATLATMSPRRRVVSSFRATAARPLTSLPLQRQRHTTSVRY